MIMTTKHILTLSSVSLLGASAAWATADYGPAVDRMITGCAKWYTSGYGHKFCVVHAMEGYYLTATSYLRRCDIPSSCHYTVNGLTDYSGDAAPGEISQLVREAYYALHARCWNMHSLGVEHEGFGNSPAWFTDAMYQASALLHRHLCDKFGIPKDRNHIVAHGQESVPGWPAWASANFGIDPYCNTHTDPGPYWNWAKFMNLVNGAKPLRLDAFVRGTDNFLWHKWYAGAWYGWENLGGSLTSGAAAVSWGENRIDIFVRGTDSGLWQKWWDGTRWNGFLPLGGYSMGAPAVASWAPGRLDVFIRSSDNALCHRFYSGGWSGWENLGGVLASDPAAVAWGNNRLDVFARGSDNTLIHCWWDGTAWRGWESLGGVLVGAPAVASWGPGRLDVFVRGTDNALWHKWHDGGAWSSWQSLGGGLTSDPGAVSGVANGVDVFVRGTDNGMWRKWWDGTGWSHWEGHGGGLNSSPAVSSWSNTN